MGSAGDSDFLFFFCLQGVGHAVERVLESVKLIVEELVDFAQRIAIAAQAFHQCSQPFPAAFARHGEPQRAQPQYR